MKKLLLTTSIVAISLALSHFAIAQDKDQDADHKARVEQAKLLMTVSPPQDLVDQMLASIAKNPRAQFSDADIKSIEASMDYSLLDKTMEDALVKNFTVDELKTMTQLYGSPTGKSIIHKMPNYMGDIQPVLQQQMREHVMEFMNKKQAQQSTSAPATSVPTPASPAPTAAATTTSAPATPAPEKAAPQPSPSDKTGK